MKKYSFMKRMGLMVGAMVLATSILPTGGTLTAEASEVKAAAAHNFPDVKDFKEEISYLSGLGIINGHTDGTFKPLDNLKRVHAVQMVLREMKITKFDAPNPGFADMKPGSYGYDEVAKAVQLGFINGSTNKNGQKVFSPNGTLTRGEMAKILTEAYKITKDNNVTFKDVSASHWTKPYVSRLATANITNGYPDGSFKPNDKIQRQHFSAFMARHLNPAFKPAPAPKPTPAPEPVEPKKAAFLSQSAFDKHFMSAISTKGTGDKLFQKSDTSYNATLLQTTDPALTARYNAVFFYHDTVKPISMMVNTKVVRDNPYHKAEADKAILVTTQAFFGANHQASKEILDVVKKNMNAKGYSEKKVMFGGREATVNISEFSIKIHFGFN